MGTGHRFEVAVEFRIPDARRERLKDTRYSLARYEVAIGTDERGEIADLGENLWLRDPSSSNGSGHSKQSQGDLFPRPPAEPPEYIVLPDEKRAPPNWKKVVTKKGSGNDYFISETTGWNSPFRLGPKKLALANLPEDEERFPVATWVKGVLLGGVQRVFLDSEAMRRPSRPQSPRSFQPDGSNLPWVIQELEKDRQRFALWIEHVQTALPDVENIDTAERPEDRHRYLRIHYGNGLIAPSWIVSDGTLRLLALTLIAYADVADRIFLIEEPENGIHPRAVEAVFQSLSSVYQSQILCATHSPVFLSLAEPKDILCLGRDSAGATDIVRGDKHPRLLDWRKETDLGVVFAAGILG